MYDNEVKFIASLLTEIEQDYPRVYMEINTYTRGASSSLEYYGMLKAALNIAYTKGQLPVSFEQKITDLNHSISIIFGE